jgi:hypothetical protein
METAFACNIKAMDDVQRQGYGILTKELMQIRQEVRELNDGYAIRFEPKMQTISDIAEFIGCERLCCPFFDLEMIAERENGSLWLNLRGREGVKEFIRHEFGF